VDRRSIQQDAGVREGGGEVSVEIGCDVCGGEACAGSGKYAVCSEYCAMVAKEYTKRDARIANLQSLIADAPHDQECASLRWFSDEFGDCDCWRSRALEGEKQ